MFERYLMVEAPTSSVTVDFLGWGTCVRLSIHDSVLHINVRVVDGEAGATWRESDIELPLQDNPLCPVTPHWAEVESALRDLLARIFRDGGQRAAAEGTGAVNAAHLAVAAAFADTDEQVREAYLRGFVEGDSNCRGEAAEFPDELEEAALASWRTFLAQTRRSSL